MISRLWMASLLVCGLFIAEDPAVIAVRTRLDGSATTLLALDAALALAMIGYNFAASRYVVSVASAQNILEAMSTVDERRAERINRIRRPLVRRVRRTIAHLNPFDLIKIAGDHLGRSLERATSSARNRRFYRIARILEDLSVVNLLGVPGAGLALACRGHRISRLQSLRHCVLFVASWFVGFRCVEWLLDRARHVPVLGSVFDTVFAVIGHVFGTLTDIQRPIGAVFVTAVMLSIVHYSVQVERVAGQHAVPGAIELAEPCAIDSN